VRKRSTKRKKK